MTHPVAATKLAARQVAKPWGRSKLPPPFSNPGEECIGEIWFEPVTGPALPLLAKYLFTSEKLSIQVHPDDYQAQARGLSGGKEECWLVLDAEPGATLGIGTLRPLSEDELRAAALSGEIERLIDWKPVQRGDFFYIPAGTVHAIGAGVSLIEMQQNADVTYRIYDYGRSRELHLDDAATVARASPYPAALHRNIDISVDQMLVDGPHFSLLLTGENNARLRGTGPLLIIPIAGSVTAHAQGAPVSVGVGGCLSVTGDPYFVPDPGARLLLARAKGGWLE
jgi:mannose-6-phosphate isomerase